MVENQAYGSCAVGKNFQSRRRHLVWRRLRNESQSTNWKQVCTGLLLALLMFSTVARSQSSGFAILKVSPSASLAGIGSSNLIADSDPFISWVNPAGASAREIQLGFTYRRWLEGLNSQLLSVGSTVRGWRLTAILLNSSVSEIPIREIPGEPIGTFNQHNLALNISVAKNISGPLSIGFGITGLYEQIYVDEVTTFMINFGAVYSVSSIGATFGGAITHLGTGASFRVEKTRPPTSVSIGATKELEFPYFSSAATISAAAVKSQGENVAHLRLGAEVWFNKVIAARGGFESGYEAHSLSFGLGVRYQFLQFDYAFVPYRFGMRDMHWLSIGLAFSLSDEG